MLTATVAGRTVRLDGCDGMLHAEKFARFAPPADTPVDQHITVLYAASVEAPNGTPVGNDGMVDWYDFASGERQLYHRQGGFSLTFTSDFSKVTLCLREGFPKTDVLHYLYVTQCILYHALAHGALGFHAAAWVCGDQAFVIAGDSGTGKTTLTNRLLERFPEAVVLGEETVIVTRDKDGWRVYGTPLCGQDERFTAASAPLGGIVLLEKSDTDRVYRASDAAAVFRMTASTLRPVYHEALCETALDRVIGLTRSVPIYCFAHTAGPRALDVLMSALGDGI